MNKELQIEYLRETGEKPYASEVKVYMRTNPDIGDSDTYEDDDLVEEDTTYIVYPVPYVEWLENKLTNQS